MLSRSSIRMGCPFASIVKATAPVVAPHVPAIVNDFYPRMFRQNPETQAFFNKANQFADPPLQRQALANAVVAYASNIDDLTPLLGPVDLICHKHAGLNVLPDHYPIVHNNLMESIGHILGEAVTPEIGEGWSDAVLALAQLLWEKEEELYKMAEKRQGGWRGAKEFIVKEKRQVSDNCVEFTFEAAENPGPIDFTAGQFLTLHLRKINPEATPRHYTVTSKPGESFLKCCIKKIDGGMISNTMHDLQEGATVELSPPFGCFTFNDEAPAVLISAGIGATPMKCFLEAKKDNVKFALHIDKNDSVLPFKDDFAAVPHHFHLTEQSQRPDLSKLVDEVLKPHLDGNNVYLCGPNDWMASMKDALKDSGAKHIFSEAFGPELAG